jgi:hypothetical protein
MPGLRSRQVDTITSKYLMVGDRGISCEQLLGHYQTTDYGKHHEGQSLRFIKWPYDRTTKRRDLGPGVDPVNHGNSVKNIVEQVLGRLAASSGKILDISSDEISGLYFATTVHDFGENTHPYFTERFGGTVGDLPRGTKGPEQRALEWLILTEVMQSTFSNLPDGLLQFAVDMSMHARSTSDSLAGRVFEMSHEDGEYETCSTAQELAIAAFEAGDIDSWRTKMLVGIGQCATGPRDNLEGFIPDFPFLEELLITREPSHDRFAAFTSS